MRIKIVSDGTQWGTKVTNAETGEEIERVLSVYWTHEAGQSPQALIRVLAEVELVAAEAGIKETPRDVRQ